MFEKPIREWTAKDVLRLQEEGASEDHTLEFKGDLAVSKAKADSKDIWYQNQTVIGETAASDIARELVAFANTSGGMLVLGAVESDMKHEPNVIVGLRCLPSCVALADALRRSCRDLIEPKLDVVEYSGIPMTEDGSGVVLISTNQSRLRPHRLIKNKECYFRRGESSVPMTMDEIRNVILSSISQEQRELELYQKRREDLIKFLGKFDRYRSIRIMCVITPMDRLILPNIVRNDLLRHPSINFPVRLIYENGERTNSAQFAFGSATSWQTTLRGIQALCDDERYFGIRQMFEDGSVCFGFTFSEGKQEATVAAPWVAGLVSNALYAAELSRRMAGVPQMPLAMRAELSMYYGDADWRDFADRQMFRMPKLKVGTVSFPAREIRGIEEFDDALNSVDEDIWNYSGNQQPRKLSIDWNAILRSAGV